MHENLLFWYKNLKKYEEGAQPSPDLIPSGPLEGDTHFPLLTPIGASIIALTCGGVAPSNWNPGYAPDCLHWQLGLINVCKELVSL